MTKSIVVAIMLLQSKLYLFMCIKEYYIAQVII